MNHDILCSWYGKFDYTGDCDCRIIQKARHNQTQKILEKLQDHHPHCEEECEMCAEWDDAISLVANIDKPERRKHDPLCNIYEKTCCPWMGECECQCNCYFIKEVREDERRRKVTYQPIDKSLFEES